eukprot:2757556-Amphidinium_carterae.1
MTQVSSGAIGCVPIVWVGIGSPRGASDSESARNRSRRLPMTCTRNFSPSEHPQAISGPETHAQPCDFM